MAQESTYTKEKGDKICEGLSQGRSLLAICKEMGLAHSTARNWESDIEEHAANSRRARELGCHALADECIEIADEDSRDWEPVKNADGEIVGVRVDGEHVTRSRLKIDTRMRLIGKWLPKVYGEKLAVGGADDLPPIKTVSDDQLAARIKALQDKVNGKPDAN